MCSLNCYLAMLMEKADRQQSVAQRCPTMDGLWDGKSHAIEACSSIGATLDVAMVICCCFTRALPTCITEPCQSDVAAGELWRQQGGSSGQEECLDIPCGKTGLMTKTDQNSLVGGRLGSVTTLGSPVSFSGWFHNKRVSPRGVVGPPQDSRMVGQLPCSVPTHCVTVCLEPPWKTGPSRMVLPGPSSRWERCPDHWNSQAPLSRQGHPSSIIHSSIHH